MARKKEAKSSGPARTRSKPKGKAALGSESEKRPASPNLWGIAGRREAMEMRRLWQLRIPRR